MLGTLFGGDEAIGRGRPDEGVDRADAGAAAKGTKAMIAKQRLNREDR